MDFLWEKHVQFIRRKEANASDDMESITQSHLKVCGVYWAITTLHMLGRVTEEDKVHLTEFVEKCYDEKTGGYGGNIGYDGHIYTTLSAVQVLCTLGKRDLIPIDAVAKCL